MSKFKSYDSYEDSFKDYVHLLKTNDRYQSALRQAENPEKFITGLQKAGYATDPNYVHKVMDIYQGQLINNLET